MASKAVKSLWTVWVLACQSRG